MKRAIKKETDKSIITYDEISNRHSVLIKYKNGSYSIVFLEDGEFTTLLIKEYDRPDSRFNRVCSFIAAETIPDLLCNLYSMIDEVYVFEHKSELFEYLAKICKE